MKKILLLFVALIPVFIAVIAFNKVKETPGSVKNINPFLDASISFETFNIPGQGWGFDVYVDGNEFIHQEEISTLNYAKGYETEEDAVKAAHLVINKIKCNILPPVISKNELDSLGVKY